MWCPTSTSAERRGSNPRVERSGPPPLACGSRVRSPCRRSDYILELIIEVIVLILAVIHVALELGTIKDVVFVKGQFSSKRLVTYISNGWHILSWAQDFLFIAFVAHWIWLIFDSSRDVDLDTEEFVDLEDVGRMTQQCAAYRPILYPPPITPSCRTSCTSCAAPTPSSRVPGTTSSSTS